jgi:aspartyl-tRNA(Asn)/glutamyl-tRNA(Gln) amidotransferase subunit C
MAIHREEVLHVARLARLALDDDEVERLTGQLNSILEHMDRLNDVDLRDGMTSEELPPPLAPRTMAPDPLHTSVAEMAPSERDGFFIVPRLASHEAAESGTVDGHDRSEDSGSADSDAQDVDRR